MKNNEIRWGYIPFPDCPKNEKDAKILNEALIKLAYYMSNRMRTDKDKIKRRKGK